ncbi:helix-turn-helix domain-containing protein, partial [Acidocella sp. KAb 2-4]|uniref:helix-turn-helix transcriptional regulator n=1 Tax=Acidocella sp. KAb 2-4 TaxID=2885158 RepID=UPI001D0947BE
HETTGYDCADAIVEFHHTPHPGLDYARYLPGRISFGAARNRLILPEAVLDRPILSRDDELCGLLVEQALARRPGQEHDGRTARQLRQLFIMSPGTTPPLTEAADALGLSTRTLNRRLKAEGTSYTRILAAFRNDYAKALAREGTLGTKQIAHAVGFRSHQSLRRAFTQWNGHPLGGWRGTVPDED